MVKKSYAKINFAINVVSKLDNGYHELDMVMSKIDFYDKIYVATMKEDAVKLTCTNRFIPIDERNLVFKIAHRVKDKYNIVEGLVIHIAKFIPIQAGLGGGSSNAATTLEILDEMFSLNLTLNDKIELTKDFGSDIPFFFNNGVSRVQGIGDFISNIENNLDTDIRVILVKPKLGVSTKVVYESLLYDTMVHPNVDNVVQAINDNNYDLLVKSIGNSLQETAINVCPSIKELKDELDSYGVDVSLLCGSGSTIFALTRDANVVNKVKQAHKNKKNFVYISRLLNV